MYRNSLKDVRIVTFDELLMKMRNRLGTCWLRPPEPEIALDTEDEEVFVTPLCSYDEDDMPF